MKDNLYYLPGRGGRLETGLGMELINRGYSLSGRELLGTFSRLRFSDQVERVAQDLQERFWHDAAQVIANSFGAYLFLHAQALLPPYIGKVLLLSPVVGSVTDKQTMTFYRPPRAGQLEQLVLDGTYPVPTSCRIYVGGNDWQANPESIAAFANPLGIDVTVVAGAGHMLDKAYVRSVLDDWL